MACNHRYHDCPKYPGYERCVNCGTYHSRIAPPPEEVYTADYWTHEKGHSTLAEQVYNVEQHLENGFSKNQFVLNLIDVEDRYAALEIGCAPGALLGRLKRDAKFRYVEGIEIEKRWQVVMRRIINKKGLDNCQLSFGLFPGVTSSLAGKDYSLIVACDVFEHSHKPWPFLQECARLLKKGGQLILMLPLIRDGYEMPERMWNAEEHVYLHSESNLRAMLTQAGFDLVVVDQWCPGHDTVSAIRCETPVHRLRAA